jgi:hypothetical protein
MIDGEMQEVCTSAEAWTEAGWQCVVQSVGTMASSSVRSSGRAHEARFLLAKAEAN